MAAKRSTARPQRLRANKHEHLALQSGRFLFEVYHLTPHNAASILNATYYDKVKHFLDNLDRAQALDRRATPAPLPAAALPEAATPTKAALSGCTESHDHTSWCQLWRVPPTTRAPLHFGFDSDSDNRTAFFTYM